MTKPTKTKATTKTVDDVLAQIKRAATKKDKANLAKFGISVTSKSAWGVSMASLLKIAKQVGVDHELAAELWASGIYEARMLASLIDDPARVTSVQMDAWCKDFDNWAIADTACFKLFDRTPHAWKKVTKWSAQKDEWSQRAAFALLASLALHEPKDADNAPFLKSLDLIDRASSDDRNFVKKAVSWALRSIGERNRTLFKATIALSESLTASDDATSQWLGKTTLRELAKPAVQKRLSARGA